MKNINYKALAAITLGVVCIAVPTAFVLLQNDCPSQFQFIILYILFALGIALITNYFLQGNVSVALNSAITASGGIAIFILLFYINVSDMIETKGCNENDLNGWVSINSQGANKAYVHLNNCIEQTDDKGFFTMKYNSCVNNKNQLNFKVEYQNKNYEKTISYVSGIHKLSFNENPQTNAIAETIIDNQAGQPIAQHSTTNQPENKTADIKNVRLEHDKQTGLDYILFEKCKSPKDCETQRKAAILNGQKFETQWFENGQRQSIEIARYGTQLQYDFKNLNLKK